MYVTSTMVLIFMVVPILAIMPLSLNDSQFLTYPVRAFTGRWYVELFTSSRWSLAIWNSFLIGLSAAVIAGVLGTLAAAGLSLSNFQGKRALSTLLISPMIVPVIVFGVGLALFLGPLGLVRNYGSIIAAHAALGTPFVLITVTASMSTFDRTLLRAAASLGASPVYTFYRVTMPIITPGLISGFVFAFATSFDEVIIIILIGGPEHRTLPREMFSSLRENISPTIAAAATVMTIVAILVVGAIEMLKAERK
ncbi:ABC transporter permease [Mesorhizobium sp.]|uniref:ABC transporter permease n=1 Tax=Mesorhizobium sp. TaxID=1871066 RepID=UPI000FE4E195|nr:ABC transporter permease [Mesorhizobium sp.]RWB70000.1 MAG: ABC transporter permease [Mesorhizobium sp.]